MKREISLNQTHDSWSHCHRSNKEFGTVKWLKTLSLEFRGVEQPAKVGVNGLYCSCSLQNINKNNITTNADQKHKSRAQMPSILEMIMASGKGTIFCLFSIIFSV